MKRDKIIYWISTGLVAGPMLMSAVMYLTRNPALMENFKMIELPLYLVTLLGVAKLCGALVLVTPVSEKLKEWAYAGFAFTFLGAIWTHIATGTPWVAPFVFLVVLGVSYVYWLKIRTGHRSITA